MGITKFTVKTKSPEQLEEIKKAVEQILNKPVAKKSLEELLEEWSVMEPGTWDNNQGPQGWWAVANDTGIVAYFNNEQDAFYYRLNKINHFLNTHDYTLGDLVPMP